LREGIEGKGNGRRQNFSWTGKNLRNQWGKYKRGKGKKKHDSNRRACKTMSAKKRSNGTTDFVIKKQEGSRWTGNIPREDHR